MSEKEGGWYGYLVVFAAFLVHFIVGGLGYSAAVYQRIFSAYFQADQLETVWVGTLILGMTALAGIPAVLFVYQFGHRVTVMVGGLAASLGLVASMWCEDMHEVYLAVGAMTGLGLGLSLTPSITILETYFYKHLATASAVARCGTPLGVFIFPVLLAELEARFAWKGMTLILAGVTLNLCVAGALYSPRIPRGMSVAQRRRDLVKLFHPGICRSPAFGGLIFSNFLWGIGIGIIYTFLPGYSHATGHSHDDGILLIAVSGITAFSSRAIFEIFNRSAKIDSMSTFLCTVTLTLLLTGLHPELFAHFAGQIGYCIMLGLHTGFWSVFCSFITEEYIGVDYMCVGKGYVFLSVAGGLFIGAPLAGWLIDYKDDYEIIFYLAGSCLLGASVVLMAISLAKCYYKPLHDWSDSDSESSGVSGNRVQCPQRPPAATMSPSAQPEVAGGEMEVAVVGAGAAAKAVVEMEMEGEEQEPLMVKSAVSSV